MGEMKTTGMKRETLPLLELIVVVVIFGVLAAMAIPRFSAGATRTTESDLRSDLAVLRTAIELYYDHGTYPAQKGAGAFGAEAGTAAAFVRQLTQYTDAEGRASPSPSATFRHGPYLRRGIPACSVPPGDPSSRMRLINGSAVPAYDATAPDAGWIYNCDTGYVAANSDEVDDRGVRYDTY
jgi:type II secretory pathway pseudopilin PulG